MGKKRKLRENSETEELQSEDRGEPHKKKQKKKRDKQLDSLWEEEQPKDQIKQREKKRKKNEESSKEGIKTYYLPGQIHETPDGRDPHRVFLETLYQQLPEDELARRWMMEWGLLPHEEAIKVLEAKVGEKDVRLDGVGKAKAKVKKKKTRL